MAYKVEPPVIRDIPPISKAPIFVVVLVVVVVNVVVIVVVEVAVVIVVPLRLSHYEKDIPLTLSQMEVHCHSDESHKQWNCLFFVQDHVWYFYRDKNKRMFRAATQPFY